MHIFICSSVGGKITPQQTNKQALFKKLIDAYGKNNHTYKVTIEKIEKNINEAQTKLYNAFIVKASDHFGNTFTEMQNMLSRFHPIDVYTGLHKPISEWTSKEVNKFIDLSSALLAEHGFHFK